MRRLGLLLATLAVLLTACNTSSTGGPPRTAPATSSTPVPVTSSPVRCAPPARYLRVGRPDPCLTPGQARTDDPAVICAPGSARKARAELSSAQWAERRREVERAYGLERNPGEVDHLLPLEGGGSNALVNLWPESAQQYREKDRAENALHRAMCQPGVTRVMVRQLQAAFMARWGGNR
jgi:hypothetical protein